MNLTPVSLWRHITRGVRQLFNKRADVELQEEMRHYVDQATAELVRNGMTETQARHNAQLDFGNRTVVTEDVRASLWENAMHAFFTDVKYALRMLRRSPVFTLVVILVISLGTGAVTTIFSAANAFLFRPLPGAHNTNELIQIDRITPGGKEGTQASNPYYTHLRDNNKTLTGLAAWSKVDLTISVQGALKDNSATPGYGVSAYGNIVSGNFFSVLDVRPVLGRFFLPDEDGAPLAHPVVVISHAFWQAHFAGDSGVIGRTVGVNGHPFTIIGVTPPEFRGAFTPLLTSAWVPLAMQPWMRPNRSLTDANITWLWTFGRMKPNTNRANVREEMVSLTTSFAERATEPDWARKYIDIRLVSLTGLPDDAQKAIAAFLGVLLSAAALVLFIACVNVAAMLSARAISRRHEMALRMALGAQRARIIRQLLTESVVLFTFGAVGGAIVAIAATRVFERLPLPSQEPLIIEISPDMRVLGFALAVSLFTGIVFGLAPALRAAKQDVTSRLRDDSAGSGSRRTVVSNVLVVGQLALSLVLLVCGGLLYRALDRGQRVNPGFDMHGVVVARFAPESWGYDEARTRRFFDTLRERISGIPEVSAVTFASSIPLSDEGSATFLVPDNAVGDISGNDGGRIRAQYHLVDYGYFDVLQQPLAEGRALARTDNATAAKVVVVNETFAKRAWPNASALGHTIRRGKDEQFTIVGVARDSKYNSLSEETLAFAYFPIAQSWQSNQGILVRSRASDAAIAKSIESAVREIDTALPQPVVLTLSDAASFTLFPQRVAAMVAGALGLVGLLLATVGLYGIVAYSAGRRTREIGIRMALGARGLDVTRMVVGEGMRLAAIGVVVGVAIAAASSRLLSAYLYGVSPLDVLTFTAMPLLFVAIALLASYLPARRAARANPSTVLRGG